VTSQLGVADITGYLRESGWQRQPVEWRGASVWSYGEDEVLVPGRDGMGDGDLRVREIVAVLAEVERRPRDEVVQDIRLPWADTQWFRIFPDGLPSGFTTLRDGIQLLTGVEGALRAAARAVVEGPRLAFQGDPADDVDGLLARVHLGSARPGSYVLPVRVPLDAPHARSVTSKLYQAVSVLSEVRDSTEAGELAAAEISADLCESLGELGGDHAESPFEIRFRWARSEPTEARDAAFDFQPGSAAVLRSQGQRLRLLSENGDSGAVTVTGPIQGLRHESAHADRWSIEVRGDVVVAGVSRRAIWVRLPDRATYEAAIAAHRGDKRVRIRGVVNGSGRRPELIAEPAGFEVLD
jgi:hypothetical protein